MKTKETKKPKGKKNKEQILKHLCCENPNIYTFVKRLKLEIVD